MEPSREPVADVPTLHPEVKKRLIRVGGTGLAILAVALAGAFYLYSNREVAIDNAAISAPLITLAPTSAGRLNAVYANEGDLLPAGAPVALVGTEVVKTKIAGLIVQVNDTVGAEEAAGAPVVTMIDPGALRVVGKIDENKGLSDIAIGDPVVFTVDAFGSKQYRGVVDEIAPTSNQSDIVFSVSDKRQEQTFDIKARFDTAAYPELKNGMSARMWVYRQ